VAGYRPSSWLLHQQFEPRAALLGPEWEPDTPVDFVVLLLTPPGHVRLVKVTGQHIKEMFGGMHRT
jgi:hypothetical protein